MDADDRDLVVEEVDGVLWMTIDRPDDGNMFRRQTCLELADALRHLRDTRRLRVGIITGTGDRFFCIGGQKEEGDHLDHSTVLPIVDVYELIDATAKPIIAAVNGYAVGGGNVLHTICDLTIAADTAVFRQVGPMVGSYDAGYGTWYLEGTIGRKRAKEMWYLNHRYSAQQALAMGLVNEVVEPGRLRERCQELAAEMCERGPGALAALKAAFYGRHNGVAGQARMAHDLLLTRYLRSEEAAELGQAFADRRPPDRDRFDR